MNCKKNANSNPREEKQLFHTESEKVVEIGLERLRPFKNHPFKVKEDEAMAQLMESIERYGIMNPLIVMPTREGVYQIVSGHRRKYCAEKLGYTQVPVIIRYMKEDDSIISMVDSNLHRDKILFSEKAFAYYMKNEAMNPKMVTPNLDKFASEGIRYNNAYSCQPVCGPARSAIFTGTFPHSNGMVTNCVPLGANVKTVGQRLTDNGYHCGYIGKWHLDGGDYFGFGKCPEGWDPEYWYDMKCYLNELTDEEKVASRKSETAFRENMTEEFTYAYRCTERALDFLERYQDEDFFLTVSYDEPHGPSLCPAPYNTMYEGFIFDNQPNFEDDLSKKPLMQQLWAGADIHRTAEEINHPSKALALFLGCNTFVDHEIGKVIDKINRLMPDALVIFTSDHGDMLGAHRLQMKNATAYKEVANIPLLIRGGEKGKVVDAPASHIDLVPTILDYMGLPIPKLLEGKSMLKQIYDTTEKVNDIVYTEFTRYEIDHDGFGGLQIMRAAISERYKLVLNLLDTDEFYDMEKDPYEVHNLIEDSVCVKERDAMHDALLEHMNATRDLYRGYQWSARPWRKDKKPTWQNDGYTRQRENEEYEPRQLDYDTGLPMVKAVRKKVTKDEKN